MTLSKTSSETGNSIESIPSLPDRIHNILITKGLTKEKLAEYLGVNPSYLTRAIAGKANPRRTFFRMLEVIERRPYKRFITAEKRKMTKRRERLLKERARQNALSIDDDRPYQPEQQDGERMACARCRGDGAISGFLCPDCDGEGTVPCREQGKPPE